jgi:hypothetical protein
MHRLVPSVYYSLHQLFSGNRFNTVEIHQFPMLRPSSQRPARNCLSTDSSTNWVPGWQPFHTNLLIFSSQADFQLNCQLTLSFTNQLLNVTSLNWTAARLISLIYNLRVDPTENTTSNNPSIVVMGGCLAVNWISFPRECIYQPLLRSGCCLSAYCKRMAVLIHLEVSAQRQVCTPQYIWLIMYVTWWYLFIVKT